LFPTRVVQIINLNESLGVLIANDKETYISVLLTPDCICNLEEENIKLSALRHGLVKLEKFHFTSVVHALGRRKLEDCRVIASLPLTIQCAKLMFLGANDTDVGSLLHQS
jgi:hypothetical protein